MRTEGKPDDTAEHEPGRARCKDCRLMTAPMTYERLTMIGHPKPAIAWFQVLDWLSGRRHVGCTSLPVFTRTCCQGYALR